MLKNKNPVIRNFGCPVDIVYWTDVHSKFSQSTQAWKRHPALGHFIADYKRKTNRKVIPVNGGDQGDFESLNAAAGSTLITRPNQKLSRKKTSLLGDATAFMQSYEQTIDPINAQDIFFEDNGMSELVGENYMTAGNHDDYVQKLSYEHSAMSDVMQLQQLNIRAFCAISGIKWIDFLQPLFLNGICFQHYYGSPGKRLGAQSVFNRFDYSCVFGDTHKRILINGRNPLGQTRFAYSGGCWGDPETFDLHDSDFGITIFKSVYNGECDMEWISQKTILAQYEEVEAKKEAARFSLTT